MFGIGLLAASAWVAAVWCVDTHSHLLWKNTNSRNDPSATQSPQLSPNYGSATMEAAGEATVTLAPAGEVDQPLVRAARRKKGAQRRQTPAPSSATLSAMTTHKRKSSVPEGLVAGERRCTIREFDGEQGPESGEGTVSSRPLEHEEDDSNLWPGKCSHTYAHNATNPGYWFVKFADGQTHHVSKVRLWNRADCCSHRLIGACVRFTTDGTKPSTASADVESCAMNLPAEILSNNGTGSGTELGIDMDITGMMIINQRTTTLSAYEQMHNGGSPDYIMTICGIEIYASSTQTDTTTTQQSGASTEASSVWLVVGGVLALAVVGVGAALYWCAGGGADRQDAQVF